MISHFMLFQFVKVKISELKITNIIPNIKKENHHFIVLLFVLKNLELPLPPNCEYLPRNKDLNQWIVIFRFAAKNQKIKIIGNKK